MESDNLVTLIKGLYEERSSNFSNEIGYVHPIVEALVALLKRQLNDDEVEKRLVRAKNEGEVKRILIIDEFLGKLNDHEKNEIENMMSSGKKLDEIIDYAALYIVENKRMQDGKVLHSVINSPVGIRRDILIALKKANPSEVYVTNAAIPRLEIDARKIKKKRIARWISSGLLIAVLGFGGFYSEKRIFNYFKLADQKSKLEKELSNMEKRYSELESKINKTPNDKLNFYDMDINNLKDINNFSNEEKIKELINLDAKYGIKKIRFFYK